MAKLTLNDIVSGYGTASLYNTNNTLIEAAFENTLSRDGTSPNTMSVDLDMNSNQINNLADGVGSQDACTIGQLNGLTLIGTADALPSQTTNADKFLQTDGTVLGWAHPNAATAINTPAGNIVATTVQTAINELDTEKVSIAGNETISGLKVFTAANTHSGAETHSGIETHSGAETHSGIETHSNSEVFSGTPSINLTGGQIKFPATQAASADVNTLDDYEEGTWTPVVGGSATYTTQSGTYTKLGRFVFVRGTLTINVLGTGSSYTISGLPFASAATSAGSVGIWNNIATAAVFVGCNADAGASTITFRGWGAASTGVGTGTVFGNSASVTFSCCYEV